MPEATPDSSRSRFEFGRDKRLLNAKQYQVVFDNARYKVGHSYLLLLAAPNSLNHPRLGLVIAKKNIRRAVDRNQVKRIFRETFRHCQHQLGSLDIILLARRGLGDLDQAQQHKLCRESFSRLVRKQAKSVESDSRVG